MNAPTSTNAAAANGQSALHDLFALTDEQILEIEPENRTAASPSSEIHPQSVIPSERSESRDRGNILEQASSKSARLDSSSPAAPRNDGTAQSTSDATATSHDSPEPPPWLAVQMKDPWTGQEAKELWNGIQQTKQEAAAYRAAFATPEDALALKELYPGGVNEARAAANRARLLDDIDRAYFGAASSTPEQTTTARAQLAQMMLREDPAAFREMVFAGLRALEEAGVAAGFSPPSDRANATPLPRLAKVFGAAQGGDAGQTPGIPTEPSSVPFAAVTANGPGSSVGARHAVPASVDTSMPDAHVAAYATFEKAANEDLERSVGAAISRTIEQALPNIKNVRDAATVGPRYIVPLHERLNVAIRQDVEAALKGDRQLGEQIAQILAARRFDNETRAQVVRLIGERAQQLVPVAAKRVLNDWTQTTLAAHRANASRSDAASARREVASAVALGESASPAAFSSGSRPAAMSSRGAEKNRGAMPNATHATLGARRVDYRKLSDEQILEL